MIKYSKKRKCVLLEIDMVHGDIYTVIIFQCVFDVMKYCDRRYKARGWSDSGNVMQHYIDETRLLEIRYVREVEEISVN